MDKVIQQRVKIVKHYIKNNKYGFTTADEEAKREQDDKVSKAHIQATKEETRTRQQAKMYAKIA